MLWEGYTYSRYRLCQSVINGKLIPTLMITDDLLITAWLLVLVITHNRDYGIRDVLVIVGGRATQHCQRCPKIGYTFCGFAYSYFAAF